MPEGIEKSTEENLKKMIKKYRKELVIPRLLDFQTWILLYATNIKIVGHLPVVKTTPKRKMHITNFKLNAAYVFQDYEEFKNYFLMYLDEIDEKIIKSAIYTQDSNGKIIALEVVCKNYIIQKQVEEFYQKLTPELEQKIHNNACLTSKDMLKYWQTKNVCAPCLFCGGVIENYRCRFFDNDCNACLKEFATHNMEYHYSKDDDIGPILNLEKEAKIAE